MDGGLAVLLVDGRDSVHDERQLHYGRRGRRGADDLGEVIDSDRY